MIRLAWLLLLLLLAGCTTPKGNPPPIEPIGGTTPRVIRSEQPSRPDPALQAATAGLPVAEATANTLRLRLPPATLPDFVPTGSLSPAGRWLAFTYETPTGPAGQPMVAVGAVSLPPGDGETRVMAYQINPKSSAATLPGLRLAGWLDDRRLLLIRGSSGTTPALRVEVLDVEQGRAVQAGPWFSLSGDAQYGLDDMQLWLTADRKALMLNTGDLWRVDIATLAPVRMRPALPQLKYRGPAATPGPDGWTALFGGGSDVMPLVPYTLIDLRTGVETTFASRWSRMAWGPDGRFAVLEETAEQPSVTYAEGESAVLFYPTVAIVRPDGTVTGHLSPPYGWLVARVHWATPDWLLLEAARLESDPGNPVSKNRMATTALIGVASDGGSARILWQAPNAILGGSEWLLAGRWLITEGRQIPLDGGPNVELPAGISERLFTPDPGQLIARQADGAVLRFAAGSWEATTLGQSLAVAPGSTSAVQPRVTVDLAAPWLLWHSRTPVGAVWFELFRLP